MDVSFLFIQLKGLHAIVDDLSTKLFVMNGLDHDLFHENVELFIDEKWKRLLPTLSRLGSCEFENGK